MAQQFRTFKDSVKHFSVSLPDTWTFIPDYKDNYFLAHRPVKIKGESKIENVVLSSVQDNTAKDLDEAYLSSVLSNQVQDSTFVLEKESGKEKPTYRWYISTHKRKITNDEIKNLTVVFYIHNHIYILQCTASPKTFDSFRNIFLKIADSLELN